MPSRKVNRDRQRIIGHRLFLEKERTRAKAAKNLRMQADRALEEYNRKNESNIKWYEKDYTTISCI